MNTALSHLGGFPKRRWLLAAVVAWLLLTAASFLWNRHQLKDSTLAIAENEIRLSVQKYLVYRRWASLQGGVYVKVSETTPPNPFLAHLPDRDITTLDGRRLTLVNPAYMTRQVQELGRQQYGLRGHITSLKPLRPDNAPDDWEAAALRSFETGTGEALSVEFIDGQPYLRLMRPMVTEASCLKCHGSQGYREGDIRGGISVSTPLAPYIAASSQHTRLNTQAHALIGGFGLLALVWGGATLRRSEQKREKLIAELRQALGEVKTLGGLLPICSFCKNIRDDRGYWKRIETYIAEHSAAGFSHSICPECAKVHYPDVDIYENAEEGQGAGAASCAGGGCGPAGASGTGTARPAALEAHLHWRRVSAQSSSPSDAARHEGGSFQ